MRANRSGSAKSAAISESASAVNAPFFVTHTIEPEVDGARNYLVQDLLASEYLHGLA